MFACHIYFYNLFIVHHSPLPTWMHCSPISPINIKWSAEPVLTILIQCRISILMKTMLYSIFSNWTDDYSYFFFNLKKGFGDQSESWLPVGLWGIIWVSIIIKLIPLSSQRIPSIFLSKTIIMTFIPDKNTDCTRNILTSYSHNMH